MLEGEASEVKREPSIVTKTDIEFENSASRVNFLKDYPETRIADRVLGPYRMGQEVELPLCIAQHLVEMGYAKFRDDQQPTLHTLSRTPCRGTLPAPKQVPRRSGRVYL